MNFEISPVDLLEFVDLLEVINQEGLMNSYDHDGTIIFAVRCVRCDCSGALLTFSVRKFLSNFKVRNRFRPTYSSNFKILFDSKFQPNLKILTR